MNPLPTRQSAPIRAPIWNKSPLNCPICRKHFAMRTIRIVKHDGRWTCHGCALKATGTPPPIQAITLEQYRDLPNLRCATCHLAIGDRQTTINVHGLLVHRHCPQKQDPNRRDRRNRNRRRTRAG